MFVREFSSLEVRQQHVGLGGATSPDGYSPKPLTSGWSPDPVKSGTRFIGALLVRF
jgi:hypothetical protein